MAPSGRTSRNHDDGRVTGASFNHRLLADHSAAFIGPTGQIMDTHAVWPISESDAMNVTHLGRGPTFAQKVALWWQTPQCTALDCTRVQRIEFDHRTDWHNTHHTRLDDGDGLCGHCHDLKTY